MSPSRLLLALCVPLLVTACSSSSDNPTVAPPNSSSSSSSSPAATLPVATAYLVTAGKGVSEKDLDNAAVSLRKLTGVVKVTKIGNDQLRVDLTMDRLPDDVAQIRKQLLELGTVVVP